MFLHEYQGEGQQVANHDAAQDNQQSIVKEEVAHLAVACSESLHDADEIGAFQDDDEESAHCREDGDANHQDEDDGDVHVEQSEPSEYLRMLHADAHAGVVGAVGILLVVHLVHHSQQRLVFSFISAKIGTKE